MTLHSKGTHFFDILVTGLAWLGCLLLLAALIAVCLDVVMRYFFNSPIPGVLQFSEYILLYIPFLAAAYVLREESHIRIDIVLNRFNPRGQSKINLVTSLVGFLVLLILSYYGFDVTFDYFQRKIPTLKYYKIPEYLVIMIIPFGCLLFGLQFLRRACDSYRVFKNEKRHRPGVRQEDP